MSPRERSLEDAAEAIMNKSDESVEDLTADTELFEDSEDDELVDLVDQFNEAEASDEEDSYGSYSESDED